MTSAQKKKITGWHLQAMSLCDQAMAARVAHKREEATVLFRQALASERKAAEAVAGAPALEPTRSVLHRSAAALAVECGEHRLAEKLIATALAGEPPDEVAEELRELLEQVNLRRRLAKLGAQEQPRRAAGQGEVVVVGSLLFANATHANKKTIKILDTDGGVHTFDVRTNQLADIVKPLWEAKVVVTGEKHGKSLRLRHIEKASE